MDARSGGVGQGADAFGVGRGGADAKSDDVNNGGGCICIRGGAGWLRRVGGKVGAQLLHEK